jgi:hypothetical protein
MVIFWPLAFLFSPQISSWNQISCPQAPRMLREQEADFDELQGEA